MEGLKKLFLPITATIQYIQNHFKAMIFLLIVFLIFAPTSEDQLTPANLQKITLNGPIFEVSDVLEQIEEAQKNSAIKGVLFDINSPGGAIAPSIELAYAIKRLREHKPVVAYSSGIMASGSYYAAIWADEIITNPGTMVGSIGVIIQGADLSEIMDKIGIKSQVVKAGKYKQVGTADRPWEDYEINELNKVIQANYEMFYSDVAKARGLDIKHKDSFANAHIFTAAQAKEVGLVDRIGVRYDAKKALVSLSGVSEANWKKEDQIDKFMKKFAAQGASLVHIYFPSLSLR
ncbi:MAG: signal peptide peptidase SppA [Campylobacterota bacterium]|nr:signal peptide peptidase SppA [Campylobacterota bacterium]